VPREQTTVSKNGDNVAWATVVQQLEDAREYLGELIRRMTEEEDFGEADLRIVLGHVYSHLNRAWHMRDATGEQVTEFSDEQWGALSGLPKDLEPT
jgi:hypothetical protein